MNGVRRSYVRRDVYNAMRERERSEKELFSHVDAQDLKAIEEDNAALGKSVEKEYQILIQLHKRQKHQTAAVMIHLRHIHNKRIEAHQGTGNPDIHNVGSTASA